MKKIKIAKITRIVELQAAKHFNYLQNIIVPNVSWGIGIRYEADLIVLRPSGYAAEIEIKATESDLKRDKEKKHYHDGWHYKYGQLFRELWFAVPEHLMFSIYLPKDVGIFFVQNYNNRYYGKVLRRPKTRKNAIRWPESLRLKLLHLGVMRIWGLKERIRLT